MASLASVTIVSSPYHTGLRDHRVGDGPNRILSRGLVDSLKKLGLRVSVVELERVDDYEGEIGRSFAILAQTSKAVSKAVAASSFPLILSGNCMASVGVACGLGPEGLGYIYFDAHDDFHTPSTLTHGYFDAMGLPILAGESFHAAAKAIPGFKPTDYKGRFLYCGLRDISPGQAERIEEHGMEALWGNTSNSVDYVAELSNKLQTAQLPPALVHLDLDVLDETVGKVNGYESPGGLSEEELVKCMKLVPQHVEARSLVVCSFDPNLGDGDKIADIAIQAIVSFLQSRLNRADQR